jgi:hypothetical protein
MLRGDLAQLAMAAEQVTRTITVGRSRMSLSAVTDLPLLA